MNAYAYDDGDEGDGGYHPPCPGCGERIQHLDMVYRTRHDEIVHVGCVPYSFSRPPGPGIRGRDRDEHSEGRSVNASEHRMRSARVEHERRLVARGDRCAIERMVRRAMGID